MKSSAHSSTDSGRRSSAKIAVVGAGFAGLAVAYVLSQKNHDLTLYADRFPSGASRVAAGLLHGFVGRECRKNRDADLAFAKTKVLLEAASNALGEKVYTENGILRVALSETQASAFRKAAEDYPELKERPEGVFIPNGIAVHCEDYLKGLLKATGAPLILNEGPKEYDRIIYCMGACTPGVKLNLIKGQILKLRTDTPLPFPLISSKYIAPDKDPRYVWAGSTYERVFKDDKPDIELAKELILPEAVKLFPPLAGAEVVDCQAALRAFTPDKVPRWSRLGENSWALYGLGSKGLLYHAYLAEQLADSLTESL